MIELPPPDPKIEGLHTALDGDAMARLFDRSFQRSIVRSCTPHYVKYNPGKYCRVQYTLELIDLDSGRPTQQEAHVSLLQRERARKLARKHRLTSSSQRATYLAQSSAIVQLWPFDLALPGLSAAASPRIMARRFHDALPGRKARWLPSCTVQRLRYKAGKRAVIKYGLNGSARGCVYGKIRKDGAASLAHAGDALTRAGVSTPETLAFFADLGMIVQAEGSGVRLKDLRGSAAYERWLPEVAGALAHLHSGPIESLPTHSQEMEARELLNEARIIGALLPHLASEAESLARRLVPMLTAGGTITTAIHGSFHDDQVLVGERGVTFVDVDGAANGDPMNDVGHFLSYLSAEGAVAAREQFLDAYSAARGAGSGDPRIHESASLLRWATLPFRELRPGWPQDVRRRVRRAAERLDG